MEHHGRQILQTESLLDQEARSAAAPGAGASGTAGEGGWHERLERDSKAHTAGSAPEGVRGRDCIRLDPMTKQADILPRSLPPRGLSRVQAATYVGVSTTLFDAMVSDGSMPGPKRYHTRTIWDRASLDEAFAALPGDGEVNPWDDAA